MTYEDKEAKTSSTKATESLQEQEKPLEEEESNPSKNNKTSEQEAETVSPSELEEMDKTPVAQEQELTTESEQPKQYLMEVSPKEWQKHHDNWLNAVVRHMIGDPKPPIIPNLHAHIPVYRPGPDLDIKVVPINNYVTRYDLRIKVAAGENQVELFHQAFCKGFLKVWEADSSAIIYPWAETV